MALTAQEISDLGLGLVTDSYLNISNLATAGSLFPGRFYLINDRADLGIILQADSTTSLSITGSGGFLNPDYQNFGNTITSDPNYAGIFGITGITPINQQGCWRLALESGGGAAQFHTGDIVIWDGLNYQVIDESLFDGSDPALNSGGAYSASLPKATANVGYITEWDIVNFNFSGNQLLMRSDKRNNIVYDIVTGIPTTIPFFQWGNDSVFSNTVGNVSQTLTTFLTCLNNRGFIMGNIVSYRSTISADMNDGFIEGNVVDTNSSIDATNQVFTGDITGNKISGTADITATNNTGSIDRNILTNNCVLNATNNSGSVNDNVSLSDGNINAINNSGNIQGNVFEAVGTYDGGSNSGDFIRNFIGADMTITGNLNGGTVVQDCVFNIPLASFTLPAAVAYTGKILTPLGSTFDFELDAAANYSGVKITIPANLDYVGIFKLTNNAGGNISNLGGAVPTLFPFQIQCDNGISNTIAPLTVAGASTGDIVNNDVLHTAYTLVGRTNGADFAEFELNGNLVAEINKQVYQ